MTVDDLPWRWGDFSDNNTIVVVGLPPGQHKVLIELADPEHRIFTRADGDVHGARPDEMTHEGGAATNPGRTPTEDKSIRPFSGRGLSRPGDVADRGGHFAMWEHVELFAAELRAAFKSLR